MKNSAPRPSPTEALRLCLTFSRRLHDDARRHALLARIASVAATFGSMRRCKAMTRGGRTLVGQLARTNVQPTGAVVPV
eukprot:scaffold213061_cov28-Tisochrysis_lutea.AAC.1